MRKKTDPRLSDTRRIKSSGNVFLDLGFDPAEAKVMALRAEVMIRMEQHLKAQGWTQAEAAKRLGMKHFLLAVSVALVAATAPIGLVAQTPPKAPTFVVDASWPQLPNHWVLGEVTSISVDRNDRIWVLHVPQSIPEAQRANAAPPV